MKSRPLTSLLVIALLALAVWGGVAAWSSNAVQMMLLSRASLPELEQSVAGNPNDWRTQYWFGKRAAEAGDFARAEPALRAAAGTRPDFLPATTEVGKVLLAEGKVEEAFQILRMVVGRDPHQWEAQLALAQLYRQEGAYHKAIEILDPLRQQRPKDVMVLYELAANQSGATQFQAAESSLRKARELDPKNGGVLTALSLVRRQQGDPQQAESFAREAVRLQPDDPKALIELARVLNALPPDAARQSEALDLLRKADNLDLNNPAILLEIGRTLTLRGAWPDAASYLLRANALASTTDTLFLLSRCAREMGRAADSQRWEQLFKRKQKQGETLKNLLTQLESNPDDAKVRFDLGKLFEEDGQIGKALNYYRSGLQRDPQNEAVRKHVADMIRNSLERGNGAAPH